MAPKASMRRSPGQDIITCSLTKIDHLVPLAFRIPSQTEVICHLSFHQQQYDHVGTIVSQTSPCRIHHCCAAFDVRSQWFRCYAMRFRSSPSRGPEDLRTTQTWSQTLANNRTTSPSVRAGVATGLLLRSLYRHDLSANNSRERCRSQESVLHKG